MFPNLAALLRKVGRLEAARKARAVAMPPGLGPEGVRLWNEWVAELDAESDPHAREVKRVALQCMDAETVAIAARVRSGG
jgi:hypothetical protein